MVLISLVRTLLGCLFLLVIITLVILLMPFGLIIPSLEHVIDTLLAAGDHVRDIFESEV